MARVVARAPVADFEDGVPRRLPYPPYDIAVVLLGGVAFAIEDACNHAGASLTDGPREGETLVCPMHGFVFSLRTGKLVVPEGLCDDQRCFRAVIEGDEVVVYDDFAIEIALPGVS